MSTLLQPARFAVASFDPLSIAWAHAYWAEGPEFVALGKTDGGDVATIPDEAGTADGVQSTGAKVPKYRASFAGLNSKPAIEGDGVDDCWQTANFTALTQPNTVVAVALCNPLPGVASAGVLCDGNDVTNRHEVYINHAAGVVWGVAAGGLGVEGGTPTTVGHLMVATFDATDTLEIDGASVASGDGGSASVDGLSILSYYALNAVFWAGPIAFLGLFDGVLSAQQKADLRTWSQSHYGTP